MALNTITPLTEYTFVVSSDEITELGNGKIARVITFEYQNPDELTLAGQFYEFVQTEECTELGIAVQPYGAFIMNTLAPTTPSSVTVVYPYPVIKTPAGLLTGNVALDSLELGDEVTFTSSDSEI